MFEPRPSAPHVVPPKKKLPKLPMTALSQYTDCFASPGDEEYKTIDDDGKDEKPRLLRNKEYAHQVGSDLTRCLTGAGPILEKSSAQKCGWVYIDAHMMQIGGSLACLVTT